MTSTAVRNVPFFMHDLGKPELDALAEVLANPILTTGVWVERFEKQFAEYLKVRHAIGVTSCTGALHLARQQWPAAAFARVPRGDRGDPAGEARPRGAVLTCSRPSRSS